MLTGAALLPAPMVAAICGQSCLSWTSGIVKRPHVFPTATKPLLAAQCELNLLQCELDVELVDFRQVVRDARNQGSFFSYG